jgi:hypothetical protein
MKCRIRSLTEGIVAYCQWTPVRLALVSVHTKGAMFAMMMSLTFLTGIVGNAHAGGMMLLSDTNLSLAVNAYGGAKNGTPLALVNNCTPYNTDCTFTYHDGMLLSDTNPSLAVNAYGGARNGAPVKLVNNCTPDNSDCLWTFFNGEWFNATSGLAVNAYGGAKNGTELELVNNCTPDNTDCTWGITYYVGGLL